MSVEISFPFEFIVQGTPVSQQMKRTASRLEWKQRVKDASYCVLPEGHFSTEDRLSITIFYFPDAQMVGDIDNIVKPILDSLSNHVYVDDRQIERIVVQKFEPGRVFAFANPSSTLSEAVDGEKPLVYIRLHDDLSEGLA